MRSMGKKLMSSNPKVYLYCMDRLKSLEIPLEEFLELAERDPRGLFNRVREFVEEEVGNIHNVRLYERYLDLSKMDVVVEYLVRCDIGELSVKIIYILKIQ